MARVGAGCTPYNEQRIGMSIGAGANISRFAYFNAFGNTIINPRITAISPAGIVEVTFVNRGNPTTVRVHGSLLNTGAAVNIADINGNPAPIGPEIDRVGFLGLGLVYGF